MLINQPRQTDATMSLAAMALEFQQVDFALQFA